MVQNLTSTNPNTLRTRRMRAELADTTVKKMGAEKHARVNLGLALLSWYALPGVSYTCEEIAAWCGCTESAIHLIEQSALRKIRNRLRFIDPALGDGLFTELFDRREPAARTPRY